MKIDRNSVRAAADKAGIFDHDCISTIDKLMDFLLVYNYQPKEDDEAWREECLKKQAAGVRFQHWTVDGWDDGSWSFIDPKQMYREVPQEVSASECQKALEHLAKTYSADKGTASLNPPTPHAAERALWKAQREAGTNEVWQVTRGNDCWNDIPVTQEPRWTPGYKYRPKPKPAKLTAKIVRICKLVRYRSLTVQDWEFYGTPEEYRAECEKYGYMVVSDITEVKPKTVKRYMAMLRHESCKLIDSKVFESEEDVNKYAEHHLCTIVGNIEEREVSVE